MSNSVIAHWGWVPALAIFHTGKYHPPWVGISASQTTRPGDTRQVIYHVFSFVFFALKHFRVDTRRKTPNYLPCLEWILYFFLPWQRFLSGLFFGGTIRPAKSSFCVVAALIRSSNDLRLILLTDWCLFHTVKGSSHRIHVWYVYQHLPYNATICRQILYNRWILWGWTPWTLRKTRITLVERLHSSKPIISTYLRKLMINFVMNPLDFDLKMIN